MNNEYSGIIDVWFLCGKVPIGNHSMAAKHPARRISQDAAIPMKRVVVQIMSQKGFTQNTFYETLQRVWSESVGEMIASQTQIGQLNRGTLEIFVSSAVITQELSFRTVELVEKLNTAMPDKKITKIKFTNGM